MTTTPTGFNAGEIAFTEEPHGIYLSIGGEVIAGAPNESRRGRALLHLKQQLLRSLKLPETAPAGDAEKLAELRRCLETLRPYTGHPVGGPGSAVRVRQEDQAAAYQAAIVALDGIASGYELLSNPATVHLNMLHGRIAKPTWQQIEHLYPSEVASLRSAPQWRTEQVEALARAMWQLLDDMGAGHAVCDQAKQEAISAFEPFRASVQGGEC